MAKRKFVQRYFTARGTKRKVDEPSVTWPTSHIVAVPIGLKHVGIALPIWICRRKQPFPSDLARNVKWATFLNSQERCVPIFSQRLSQREIQARRKVGIDGRNRHAI